MSTSKFKQVERDIVAVEKKLVEINTRKADVEKQIVESNKSLQELLNKFEMALVSNDPAAVTKLKGQIQRANEATQQDQSLVSGLTKELKRLEVRLPELKQHRSELFKGLSEKYLSRIIPDYSSAAQALADQVKRLLVCHEMLRAEGHGSVYSQTVGPGMNHLPAVKIPRLGKEIDPDLSGGQFHLGRAFQEKIFAEIVG